MWLPMLLILLLGLASSSPAATIHVPGDQPTIQAGVDAARMDDTVLVASGTYHEHDIALRAGVCLRGQTGEPGGVTIDAQRLGRVISCQSLLPAPSIEGFTLTGGYVSQQRGGAILVSHSSPRISKCLMTGNEASAGGGGIFALYSAALIEDCVFTGNSGVDGGGIYIDYASPQINGCTFYDNEVLVWGGAVFCENGSSPHLQNCTIVGNHAYQGGGIWCVANCYPVMTNCLVAFSRQGEGVYVCENHSDPSMITLACCDVFGNAGANYGGAIEDQTGIDGNISSDPLLCDLPNHDFRVADISPCLPENNGCGVLIGANGQGCTLAGIGPTGIEANLPRLEQNVPNPFSSGTEIGFTLPVAARITLTIVDPTGRRVRDLIVDQSYPAGPHHLRWDGRDDAGRSLACGVYLSRLECGSSVESRRIVLLK